MSCRNIGIMMLVVALGASSTSAVSIPAWDGGSFFPPPGGLIEYNQEAKQLYVWCGETLRSYDGTGSWNTVVSNIETDTGMTFEYAGFAFNAAGTSAMVNAGWPTGTAQVGITPPSSTVKTGIPYNYYDAATSPVSGSIFANKSSGGVNNRLQRVSLAGTGSETELWTLSSTPEHDGFTVSSGGLGFDPSGNLYLSSMETPPWGEDPLGNNHGYIDVYRFNASDLEGTGPISASRIINDLVGSGSGQIVSDSSGRVYISSGVGIIMVIPGTGEDDFATVSVAGNYFGDSYATWDIFGMTMGARDMLYWGERPYGQWGASLTLNAAIMPEPSSLILFGLGVVALLQRRRNG
jgi:hypothetical protein